MFGANNPVTTTIDIVSTAAASLPTTQTPAPPAGSPAFYNLMASWPGTALLATGVVVAGAGIVTYGGIKWIMHKYEESVEEAFLDKIDKISKIHKDCLVNIPVYGKETQISLPPIFKTTEVSKGKTNVDAIHFPDEVIRKKAENIPQQTARSLSPYKECIFNTIQELKTFYFSLPDSTKSKDNEKADVRKENGVTRAIISYLIEMLDSHCLNFQGYDYDIAVLERLGKFINEYATDNDLREDRDASHLRKVYPWIRQARKHLVDHQKMLNLQEITSEIFSDCRDASDHLIRYYAMLVNNEDYHKEMRTVIKNTIAEGKIKNQYIKSSHLFGKLNSHSNEVKIYESPFKQNLMDHAQYAINVIDTNRILTKEEIPEVNIILPDHERLKILESKSKLTDAEQKEKKIIEKQFEKLAEMFVECKNFITTRVEQKTIKKTSHIPFTVKERELLIERSKYIIEIANLINEIVTLQYYVNNIGKGLESLGEIAIMSEKNKQVFDVTTATLDKIRDSVKDIKDKFEEIEKFNKYAMEGKYAWLREDMDNKLNMINKFIETAKTRITNYWNKKNENTTEELEEKAEGDLYTATDLVAEKLNLNVKKKYEVPKLNMSTNIDDNPACVYFDKVLHLDTARNDGTLRQKKAIERKDVNDIDWNQSNNEINTNAINKDEKKEELIISKKTRRLSRRNSSKKFGEISDVMQDQNEINENDDSYAKTLNSKKDKRNSDVRKERRKSTGKSIADTKLGKALKRLSGDKYNLSNYQDELNSTASYSQVSDQSFTTADIQRLLPKSMPGRNDLKLANQTLDDFHDENDDFLHMEENERKDKRNSKSVKRRSISLDQHDYSNENFQEKINLYKSNQEEPAITENKSDINKGDINTSKRRLLRESSSMINLRKNLNGGDNSESEDVIEESSESVAAQITFEYYHRLDLVNAKLKYIKEKIPNLNDADQEEKNVYKKLHASLDQDYQKLRELMADKDRPQDDRNGKVEEMLHILEQISIKVKNFLNNNMSKDDRINNISTLNDSINLLITNSSRSVFIDKYKPGVKGWIYSFFSNTECRDKLNDIGKVCEDIAKLAPAKLLTVL